MRKIRNRLFVTLLSLIVVLSMSATAFASGGEYLCLGADLKAEELATVLELLGVQDINDYDVTYITNADEKNYLGSYVSAAQIGSQALSSVLISETGGSRIDVETYNIGYCTQDMYRNALATAGVSGAKVKVAGPVEISGTAALVGTIKVYEKMTGEPVSDEVIETCVDELTTTGDIGEELGDKEGVSALIAELKEQLANNPNMSESELEEAIRSAAEKLGLSLSEQNIQKVKSLLQKLQNSDIDWDNVKKQSGNILKGLKDRIGDIDIDKEEAKGIFAQLIDWIKGLINK